MAHLDGPLMGCVPRRMWWKPWKWQVTPLNWTCPYDARLGEYMRYTEDGPTITDLTEAGAIGIMKLYGIKHKDFETN